MQPEIHRGRFLAWWFLSVTLIYLSVLALTILGRNFSSFFMSTCFCAVLAPGMSAIWQNNLLRDAFHWPSQEWGAYSILGGIFCGLLSLILTSPMNSLFPVPIKGSDGLGGIAVVITWFLLLTVPFYMSGAALGQWLSLRRIVRHAWVWFLVNTFAALIYSWILYSSYLIWEGGIKSDFAGAEIALLLVLIVTLFVQGLGTGMLMLYMLKHYARFSNNVVQSPY